MMEADRSKPGARRRLRKLVSDELKEPPPQGATRERCVLQWIRSCGTFIKDPSAADSIHRLPEHANSESIEDPTARQRAESAMDVHAAAAQTDLEVAQAAYAENLEHAGECLDDIMEAFLPLLRKEAQLLRGMANAGMSAPIRQARLKRLCLSLGILTVEGAFLMDEERAALPEEIRDGVLRSDDHEELLCWNLLERGCSAREVAAATGMLRTPSAWVDPNCGGADAAYHKTRDWRRRQDERFRNRKEEIAREDLLEAGTGSAPHRAHDSEAK